VIFTARRSYARAVLEVAILSVRPSVCLSQAYFVTKTKQGTADTTRKGNHSTFLAPTVVGGRRPFRLKFAFKVTHHPSINADFNRFPLIASQP